MSRRGDVPFDVLMQIQSLREGDQIEVRNQGVIEIHTVKSVKRVNIGTTGPDERGYNVPFVLFAGIHKKKDAMTRAAEQLKKLNEQREEFRTLKPGEPFWFKHKRNAILLYFKEFTPGKIVGISPVDNCKWTIDESMYGGRIQMPGTQAKAQ